MSVDDFLARQVDGSWLQGGSPPTMARRGYAMSWGSKTRENKARRGKKKTEEQASSCSTLCEIIQPPGLCTKRYFRPLEWGGCSCTGKREAWIYTRWLKERDCASPGRASAVILLRRVRLKMTRMSATVAVNASPQVSG